MKKWNAIFVLLCLVILTTGCELVGDIFQAGVGVGMFIVIAVLVLIVVLFARMFKK